MSLLRFKGMNHPQQVGARGARPDIDDRATVAEVFGPLDRRFRFTIDVAASANNTKCERFYDRQADGLEQPWYGERVWCNPPYSAIRPWVEKAWAEAEFTEVIVMLLPANRTEQAWWQQLVEPHRDQPGYTSLRVEFLPGRIRFLRPGKSAIGANERPPFGSCLLIWTNDRSTVIPRESTGVGPGDAHPAGRTITTMSFAGAHPTPRDR